MVLADPKTGGRRMDVVELGCPDLLSPTCPNEMHTSRVSSIKFLRRFTDITSVLVFL